MKETIKNEDAAVFRNELVRILSGDRRILGVGQTGDIHAPLIPGKSDIDLFVICSSVPSEEERSALYGGIKENQFICQEQLLFSKQETLLRFYRKLPEETGTLPGKADAYYPDCGGRKHDRRVGKDTPEDWQRTDPDVKHGDRVKNNGRISQ